MILSAELIQHASSNVNPCNEVELQLRNLNILYIENLNVTRNYYNCIDLCNNQISRLGNFSVLSKLYTLLICNNRLNQIDTDLHIQLPSVQSLILTNNSFTQLSQLQSLQKCKSLRYLSLLNNPVARIPNYRLSMIALLPQLNVLDYNKIKPDERIQSKNIQLNLTGTPNKRTRSAGEIDDDNQRRIKKQKLIEQLRTTTSLSELQRLEVELQSMHDV